METTDPKVTKPVLLAGKKDSRKLIVFLFSLSSLAALSLIVYYYYFASQLKFKEPRLTSAYLSTTRQTEAQVFDQVRDDCFELIEAGKAVEYQQQLKKDVLDKLKITDTLELLSMAKPVPETSTCWTVWVVDADGIGMVGYRDSNEELVTIAAQANKDEIEKIIKEIRSKGYEI